MLAEAGAEIPRLFLVEGEYALAMMKAEVSWVRALLDELSAGEYPDLAAWQTWHATGQVPARWAELAQRGSAPD